MDGSIVYHENGILPQETYSTSTIVSYARSWTGLVKSPERGGATSLDPMTINIQKRDLFPKSNLVNGFIVSFRQILFYIIHGLSTHHLSRFLSLSIL